MQLLLIVFPVKHQLTQSNSVEMLAKSIKRYLISTKAMQPTLPNQSVPTHENDNNHTVSQLPSQSITNPSIVTRPRKKPSLQWSITSLKSQQIVNCDDFTVKVNKYVVLFSFRF